MISYSSLPDVRIKAFIGIYSQIPRWGIVILYRNWSLKFGADFIGIVNVKRYRSCWYITALVIGRKEKRNVGILFKEWHWNNRTMKTFLCHLFFSSKIEDSVWLKLNYAVYAVSKCMSSFFCVFFQSLQVYVIFFSGAYLSTSVVLGYRPNEPKWEVLCCASTATKKSIYKNSSRRCIIEAKVSMNICCFQIIKSSQSRKF